MANAGRLQPLRRSDPATEDDSVSEAEMSVVQNHRDSVDYRRSLDASNPCGATVFGDGNPVDFGDCRGRASALVVVSVPGFKDVATVWCPACLVGMDLPGCEAVLPVGSTVELYPVAGVRDCAGAS